MKIIFRGDVPVAQPIRMDCPKCESTLEIEQSEWRKGTYGSEEVVKCAVCGIQLVKPGTEYTGDF